MRKKIIAFALALLSVLALSCPAAQTAWAAQTGEDYIAAIHTKSNGLPYYIMVDRAQSTVTVYGLDDDGYYTVPVKAMICSTGRTGHATPTGTFSIGGRWTWLHMIDGSYGQYATQISGNILFHSVCYSKKDPSTLMTEEYNGLGAPASLGCVRLQTVDAKWIYDNCARGTKVTVYDGTSPGPLGKPAKYIDSISPEEDNGWDPTDPREENPWRTVPAPASADSGSGTAAPYTAPQPLPPEQAVTYTMAAQALYQLSGETGLTEPADIVFWAAAHRFLDGIADSTFDPSAQISRQDLISMLYRYETNYRQRTANAAGLLSRFTDWTGIQLYARDAMRWAVGAGLLQGTSASTLDPNGYTSRTQLDIILQRYGQLR